MSEEDTLLPELGDDRWDNIEGSPGDNIEDSLREGAEHGD